MNRKHTMPDMKEGNVNVTPLIDVVMCLIIFFMLIAKYGVSTGALDMPNLVQSLLGTSIDDMGNTITLNVLKLPDSSGQPQISVLVPKEDGNRILTESQVVGVLKELYANNKDLKVIIRAEGDTSFAMIQGAMMACATAGVRNIDYNTKKE